MGQDAFNDPRMLSVSGQEKGSVQGMVIKPAQRRSVSYIVQQGGPGQQGRMLRGKGKAVGKIAGKGRRIAHVRKTRQVLLEKGIEGADVETRCGA